MPPAILSLPLVVLTILSVTVCVGLAVAGLLIARRWVLPHLGIEPHDSEFAGAMLQAILVFYALAIALVAVSTWEQHNAISEKSSQEAATIATLYRQAELFPGDTRDELQGQLLEYTTYIVDQDWPTQALQAGALDTFRDMVELRRLRLDAVESHLSLAMWAFVGLGAAISVASAYLFSVADVRMHATLVGLLATIIALVVTLIASNDNPFVGDLAVGPDSYQVVLDSARTAAPTP